MFETNKDNSAR